MKKQELIEGIEAVPAHNTRTRPWIDKKIVSGLIRQLDEPQKVKVPPFVSVWYRVNKDNLYKNIAYLCANWEKSTTTDNALFNWMSNTDNFVQILVNMHQFGYEVEKEKRYLVRVKGIDGYGRYLNKASSSKTYCFASEIEKYGYKTKHTRKELEEANFGWVFDCEGIEIEEVE
nr:MAG TPA: Protein of unknown function (DUF1642) [Caudoviricetes sp.]